MQMPRKVQQKESLTQGELAQTSVQHRLLKYEFVLCVLVENIVTTAGEQHSRQ